MQIEVQVISISKERPLSNRRRVHCPYKSSLVFFLENFVRSIKREPSRSCRYHKRSQKLTGLQGILLFKSSKVVISGEYCFKRWLLVACRGKPMLKYIIVSCEQMVMLSSWPEVPSYNYNYNYKER